MARLLALLIFSIYTSFSRSPSRIWISRVMAVSAQVSHCYLGPHKFLKFKSLSILIWPFFLLLLKFKSQGSFLPLGSILGHISKSFFFSKCSSNLFPCSLLCLSPVTPEDLLLPMSCSCCQVLICSSILCTSLRLIPREYLFPPPDPLHKCFPIVNSLKSTIFRWSFLLQAGVSPCIHSEWQMCPEHERALLPHTAPVLVSLSRTFLLSHFKFYPLFKV